MATAHYAKIQESIDQIISKVGSKKTALFLSKLMATIYTDIENIENGVELEKNFKHFAISFSASMLYNISFDDILFGPSRIASEARMICSHILHRKYGLSIREISMCFDGMKVGSVHRFVTMMDDYLDKPEHYESLLKNYHSIVFKSDEVLKVKNILS